MEAPSPEFGLPRSRRIKQGRDFLRAKAEGGRLTSGCLILNWVRLPGAGCSRVGVIAGRRIGEAVVRTRARRLLREAFRLKQRNLAHPIDLVLVARPSIVGKGGAEVIADLVAGLRRAQLFREGPLEPGQ